MPKLGEARAQVQLSPGNIAYVYPSEAVLAIIKTTTNHAFTRAVSGVVVTVCVARGITVSAS